ncbi:MAG: right-handed parallel beta-helix repeat-containing protein, partial [Pseudomonadota bacterium]
MAATTIQVSTAQQLLDAVETATGGETIVLASGNYGEMRFSSVNFDTPIKIISENADDPAVFE